MALAPLQPRVGASRSPAPPGERTRVMLVDDSAVVRGFLMRILSAEADMDIVATASDGALAVAALKRTPADVVILDVEMPNMDGLTAIPLLLAASPSVKIVMASTLTPKNASVSLKALSAGATDYLSKPTTATSFAGGGDFSRDLVQKSPRAGQRRAPLRQTGAARRAQHSAAARKAAGVAALRGADTEIPRHRQLDRRPAGAVHRAEGAGRRTPADLRDAAHAGVVHDHAGRTHHPGNAASAASRDRRG